MIAPKAFKGKDKEAETLLIDFDLYVKTITNFFIATRKDTANDRQKVALLQAVGGPDMVDLVEEVGKVTLVATAADVVNEVAAVEADSFERAIEKIRQGIVGKTNQAMSRLKLFQRMGQGTQKFASWYKEVFKQAKRCDWSTYNVEEAARDAIMYQTADQKLRQRILAQNKSYQETVQWHGDSLTRSQTGRHSWSRRQRTRWTGSGDWRRNWGGCRQSRSPALVARLAAARDTPQTSPVQEQSARSATRASSQDTSLVLPSAQAPPKTPRQGLGRWNTRRRRRRSGR